MADKPELYDALIAAECRVDNHESDLYVKATPEAERVIAQYPELKKSLFRSQIDRALWYEFPFRYAPWWRKRQKD